MRIENHLRAAERLLEITSDYNSEAARRYSTKLQDKFEARLALLSNFPEAFPVLYERLMSRPSRNLRVLTVQNYRIVNVVVPERDINCRLLAYGMECW